MNDFLVESVLRGVLGGRKKRSRKALSYLTGQRGGDFVNAGTLLTAAGVAWGIYETLQNQGSAGSSGSASSVGSGGASPSVPLPPLPATNAAAPDEDAIRMVRLAISAAHADGAMNEQERAAVVAQAASTGGGDFVARELEQKRPLAEIVAGVGDPAQRATLYVLAYTILRADEQVSGAERIYLAQLAHLLGLDPPTVQALEKDAAARIEAAE